MSSTRKLDKLIADAERKVAAADQGQMWPLTASERAQVVGALAGGSLKVLRGKNAGTAEEALDRVTNSIMARLNAELGALKTERARVLGEAVAAKAARKGWF